MILSTTLAALMLLTTTVFAADVAGHYVLRGVHEVGSELLLEPGGAFKYMLAYGAADYTAAGTWKVDGDSVVLTSAGNDAPPFKLVRSGLVKKEGIRVIVKGPAGHPAANIDVVLQSEGGKRTARTDSEGVALFEPAGGVKSVQFQIRVYHLDAGPYPLNPAHDEFQFEINGEAITRVPFKGERLKIKGKTLEMRYWDPDKVMNYEKR
jgi:hypothetical protein